MDKFVKVETILQPEVCILNQIHLKPSTVIKDVILHLIVRVQS